MELLLGLMLAAGVALTLKRVGRALGRRRAAAKLRRDYAAAFDPRSAPAEVDEYVLIVRGALPQLRSEPLAVPSLSAWDEQWLTEAVSSAAERFGVALSELEWRFVSDPLVPSSAGCAWRPSRTEIRLTGDRAIATTRDGPPCVWTVEVADRYRSDPEAAFLIVGHELAHVALLSRGVQITPSERNERLTDVAAGLAGFGSLMLRVARRERWTERGDTLSLTVGAVGYLHRDAVEYLHARHLAPAG